MIYLLKKVIFNSYVNVYQRVNHIVYNPETTSVARSAASGSIAPKKMGTVRRRGLVHHDFLVPWEMRDGGTSQLSTE